MTLKEFRLATLPQIKALSVSDLVGLEAEIAANQAQADTDTALFRLALNGRYKDEIALAYRDKGDDTGTAYIAASNSTDLKVEIDKRVKWDQDTLFKALNALTPDEAAFYAKTEISVPESKLLAAPPAIAAKLRPSRTVIAGKPKFTLQPHKERSAY